MSKEELRLFGRHPEWLGHVSTRFNASDSVIAAALDQEDYCPSCTSATNCKWNRLINSIEVFEETDVGEIVLKEGLRPCHVARSERTLTAAEKAFIESGLPTRYKSVTINQFDIEKNEAALDAVKQFVTKKKSVYLYGCTGSGKTMLSVITAKSAIKAKCKVVFYDTPTLLQTMRATFNQEGNGESAARTTLSDIHKRLAAAQLIILDDIGAELSSKWALEQLFIVINERYNSNSPIFVTSNYSLEQLEKHWESDFTGRRLVSRLEEFCIQAKLNNIDHRKRGRAVKNMLGI